MTFKSKAHYFLRKVHLPLCLVLSVFTLGNIQSANATSAQLLNSLDLHTFKSHKKITGFQHQILGEKDLGEDSYIRLELDQDIKGRELLKYPPGIAQNLKAKIQKGDVLKLSFMARSAESYPIMVFARLKNLKKKTINHGLLAQLNIRAGKDWQEYTIVEHVKHELSADEKTEIQLAILTNRSAGSFEIKNIALHNFGQNPEPMPTVEFDWFGGAGNPDAWRNAAQERIKDIRMGDFTLKIVDQNGQAVNNATIQVEQQRHHFNFGTAIRWQDLKAKNTTGKRYRAFVKEHYNHVTLANSLKWKPKLKELAPQMLEWARTNNLPVYGHTLYWPKKMMIPFPQRFLSKGMLSTAVESHVREYTRKYRGQLDVWDVVNEVRSSKDPEKFADPLLLANLFKIARKEDPDVKLAYNENGILGWSNGYNDPAREKFYEIIDNLKSEGAPIDQLGLQAHILYPFTPIWKVLDILDEVQLRTDLPVQITEFDVSSHNDQVQGDYIKDFLLAMFSHPSVQGFTMWGFWEGNHWKANEGAAWVRKDWSNRPSMDHYIDLVYNKWWSNEQGKSDKNGRFSTKVFLGEHKITISKEGQSMEKSFSITKNTGTVLTVKMP